MKENGIVATANAEHMTVTVKRRSCCGVCGVCSFNKSDELNLQLPNNVGAHTGDVVEFNLDAKSTGVLTKLTLAVYITPLMALIAGVALGILIKGELMGALLGLVLAAAALFATKLWERRFNLQKDIFGDIRILSEKKDG